MLLSGVVGLLTEKIVGIGPVNFAAIADKLFCVFPLHIERRRYKYMILI